MLKTLAILAAVVGTAYAQNGQPWGQCGGIGYSGVTTCPAGWTCVVGNPYYSQCLQATTTSSSKTTSTTARTTTTTARTTTTTARTTTTTTIRTTTTTSSSGGSAPSPCTGGSSGYPVLTAQYAMTTAPNGYILEQNQWGIQGYTGSQSAQLTCASGNTVAWTTTYTWSGGPSSVKTYTNIFLNQGLGKQLSSIQSIPSAWAWTYTSASSDLNADVSYDIWLSNSATVGTGASKTSTYEIMIWLSKRGSIQPAGSAIGSATINGEVWTVWKGNVSNWVDFSFVRADGSEATSFSEDLLPFFNYLVQNQGVPSSQYLVQLQSGTEPFTGSATLTTTSYSVAIN